MASKPIEPLKQGWLTKQGGFIKTWKHRWFILSKDKILHYFVKPGGKEQGSISLANVASVSVAPECRYQPAFKVCIPGVRTYYIKGETPNEVQEWISSIQQGLTAKQSDGTKKISLDDFEILRVLGKGSYGKVQLVRCKTDGQLYAMKTMSKKLLEDYEQIAQTLSERNVLLTSKCPFLVKAHFTFQTDQKIFMVLDYVPGGELFSRLKEEGKFAESRARLYAAEILLGLGHLHGLGFVYRDLKPENILVDSSGHLKITDFGLVKGGMRGGATTTTFCGTPEYIAPEILEQKPYTKVVDWWSFGILLFEMLTGLPPFYSENTNKMYRAILNDPIEYPQYMSDSAKDLIAKLLNRDPTTRLGASERDAEEIKSHVFFSSLDWKAVYDKAISPEWIPPISREADTSMFDEKYTKEEAAVSFEPDSAVTSDTQREFIDFTCVEESKLAK